MTSQYYVQFIKEIISPQKHDVLTLNNWKNETSESFHDLLLKTQENEFNMDRFLTRLSECTQVNLCNIRLASIHNFQFHPQLSHLNLSRNELTTLNLSDGVSDKCPIFEFIRK